MAFASSLKDVSLGLIEVAIDAPTMPQPRTLKSRANLFLGMFVTGDFNNAVGVAE